MRGEIRRWFPPRIDAVFGRGARRAQCGGTSGRCQRSLNHAGGFMPLIKPRTRGKQVVRRIVRLDRETNETLFAYAHFLGE